MTPKDIIKKHQKNLISLEYRLLLTLWTLSNQESFRGIADRFGLNKGHAHTIFIKMCNLISTEATSFIKWPEGQSAIENVKKFNSLRANNPIKGVFGSVDCTHILIPAPHEDSISYYDRLGHHSVIIQGIKKLLINTFRL